MRIETAEFVRSAFSRSDFVRDGRPEVAFAGRSNVGKSRLINSLLGRKALARISSSPGRTRAINYYTINDRFYLVDLPGYGYAKAGRQERKRWAELVDAYLRHSVPKRSIVLLIDGKVTGTPLDVQAVDYLSETGVSLITAVTKIDRIPRNRRSRCLAQVSDRLNLTSDCPMIPVSARTGEGMSRLWKEIIATL